MKWIAMLIIMCLFALVSCTIGTVQWSKSDQQFVNENLPIREVRVAVLNGSIYSREFIEQKMATASERFMDQAGIRLKVTYYEVVDIPILDRASFTKMGNLMMNKLRPMNDDFDIGLFVTFYTAPGYVWANVAGARFGATEDTYRRFVVLKELSSVTLEHELWHCFVIDHAHDLSGILVPASLRLMPFLPVISVGGMYLTAPSRQSALKYKWRNFRVPVSTSIMKDVEVDPYVDFSNTKTNQK